MSKAKLTRVRAARGGTDLAEGRRLRAGQEAEADLSLPDNKAKVEAGLLLPLDEKKSTTSKEEE